MKKHATLGTDSGNFLKRLDGSGLVVGMHDGDNGRLLSNQAGEKRGIDHSGGIHREQGDFETFKMLQMLGSVEDGMMLHSGDDDVFASHSVGAGDADQAEIAGFRAAACENDLVRFGSK